jgi:hypothetical protein
MHAMTQVAWCTAAVAHPHVSLFYQTGRICPSTSPACYECQMSRCKFTRSRLSTAISCTSCSFFFPSLRPLPAECNAGKTTQSAQPLALPVGTDNAHLHGTTFGKRRWCFSQAPSWPYSCNDVSPCASLLTRTSANFQRVRAAASSTSCSINTRSCSLQPQTPVLAAALHVQQVLCRCSNAATPDHRLPSASSCSEEVLTQLQRHRQPLCGRRPAWAAPGSAPGPLAHAPPAPHPVALPRGSAKQRSRGTAAACGIWDRRRGPREVLLKRRRCSTPAYVFYGASCWARTSAEIPTS